MAGEPVRDAPRASSRRPGRRWSTSCSTPWPGSGTRTCTTLHRRAGRLLPRPRGGDRLADREQRGHRATVMARLHIATRCPPGGQLDLVLEPETPGRLFVPTHRRAAGPPRPSRRTNTPWVVVRRRGNLGRPSRHDARRLVLRPACRGSAARPVRRDALVVGAGLAGLSAARSIVAAGRRATVLEATDHAGGRATTDTSLGIPLPLGGAWLHGDLGHPLAGLVSSTPDDWGAGVNFVVGHGAISDVRQREVEDLRHRIVDRSVPSPTTHPQPKRWSPPWGHTVRSTRSSERALRRGSRSRSRTCTWRRSTTSPRASATSRTSWRATTA